MFIALLGRQPLLGMAELERLYGSDSVRSFGETAALVDGSDIDVMRLGGSVKVGRIVHEFEARDWHGVSQTIVKNYHGAWSGAEGKITLGISAYGFVVSPRDVQKTGIILKGKLKSSGVSLRLIPNDDMALSSATSHHNKLGLSSNKVELLVVRSGKRVVIAESLGAQNITALAKRDQGRPKRDAFVGMLPPKLAQLMVNLAGPLTASSEESQPVVLDPFCGTGVVLQEAMLLGYQAYGSDLSEKMIRYSRDNLNWLQETFGIHGGWYLHEGDATNASWRQPINAIVCEAYLGQPFSAPPSPAKLAEVRDNCNRIISTFLKNIGSQIDSGTPLVVAVPAWRAVDGSFSHLALTDSLGTLGYKVVGFKNLKPEDLLYFREDQVVARELLVLTKA